MIDCSFALINAITLFWNTMNLTTYLIFTYDALEKSDHRALDKLVKIFICCSHYFKIIANDVNKFCPEKNQRKFFKEALAGVFNIDNLSQICEWFTHFAIVTTTKSFNDNVKESIQHLINLSVGEEEYSDDHLDPTYTKTMNYSDDPLYKKSPYYKKIMSIYNDLQNSNKALCECNPINEDNKYYNPAFLQHSIKKYIPYLPLWSGLFTNKKRPNNAYVENWFSVVKNIVLKGQFNQKCSRVIRSIRKYYPFIPKFL